MRSERAVGAVGRERLTAFIEAPIWYHTMSFGAGLGTSNATYDHRPHLQQYDFPPRLDGWTVLDVGAGDGLFSFEFERRGATRVLAVDTNAFDGTPAIEPSPAKRSRYLTKYAEAHIARTAFADVYDAIGVPVGHQFLAARELLGSRVEYRNANVHELASLERWDLVFCGDLLEHLKNPLLAIESLARATRRLCVVAVSGVLRDRQALGRGGSGVVRELLLRAAGKALGLPVVSRREAVRYVGNESGGAHFLFAPESLRQALLACGFRRVEIRALFDLRDRRTGARNPHAVFHCYTDEPAR